MDKLQVTCPNCGAGFSAEEARCPYCSTINPSGAEAAYMRQLEELKGETDKLDDDVERDFKVDLKRNTKRTVTVVIIVVVVLAALFFVANAVGKCDEQQDLRDYKAREAFREQHFGELNRLYESGDDDALSDYVWSLADDAGFDALYSWDHVDFLEVHDDWDALQFAASYFANGEGDLDDYAWAITIALHLAQLEDDDSSFGPLDAEEAQRAAPYREDAWKFLQDTLQMTPEEITAFADSVKDANGSIREDAVKQGVEPILRSLGTIG